MKKIILRTVPIVALAMLFSFRANPGGEGFELYLGSTLLTQQFGNNMNEIKTIQLPANWSSEALLLKYYHCGKAGKDRVVTFKDEQDHIIRQFHYPDGAPAMILHPETVNGIKTASYKKGATFKLVYASAEIPAGKWIANISY
jgi:hypothetical protein